MHQTLFYISQDGQELGPLSAQEITSQLESGELSELDYIYLEHVEDWVTIAEFVGEHQDKSSSTATPATEPTSESDLQMEAASESPLSHAEPLESTDIIEIHETTFEVSQPIKFELPHNPVYDDDGDLIASHSDEDMDEPEFTEDESHVEFEPNHLRQRVELNNGIAELTLEDLRPGKIRLHVVLPEKKAKAQKEIEVKGGAPHSLNLKLSKSWHAGDDKNVEIQVFDKYGNHCDDYHGTARYQINNESPKTHKIKNGSGKFSLDLYKSGDHVLKVLGTEPHLEHTSECHFEVHPGEPVSIEVQTSGTSPKAGEPHNVKIVAYDSYGNLATSYKGPIELEIHEELKTKRDPKEASLKVLSNHKKSAS